MARELLEIEPLQIKFTFEVKKQSSCLIKLGNKSDQCVAFKIKTTSPKKYSVRPNVGIIKPQGTSDFTVTMQAQRVAPPDLQCKDKFLVQSMVVPFGTTDEEITSDMFAKDTSKYIEEKKLRVVLMKPPQSPVLLLKNGELKQDSSPENSLQKDRALSGVENIPPGDRVAADVKAFKTAKVTDELTEAKDEQRFENAKETDELSAGKDMQMVENTKDMDELIRAAKHEQSRPVENAEELIPAKNILESKLAKDFEEMKLKLHVTDSQLREAEHTIMKLTEARNLASREKDMLMCELEVLRRQNRVRRVQVGLPLLYVSLVALISLVVGYLSHPRNRISL